MMTTNNKKIGNDTERKVLAVLLKAHLWWFHLFATAINGQPCDIVAMRKGENMLIDVKHCSEKSFPFSRIEPNQRTCFAMAQEKGIKCGFAVVSDNGAYYWLDWRKVRETEEKGAKSLPLKDMGDLEAEIS